MTPEEALRERDILLGQYRKGQQDEGSAGFDPEGDEYARRAFEKVVSTGRVVIWRSDLATAAMSGASAFNGASAAALDIQTPQLWFLDAGAPAFPLDDVSTLPPDTWRQYGALLVPLDHGDGRFITLVLLYKTPNGIQSRIGPSLNELVAIEGNGPCSSAACLAFLDQEFVGLERQTLPRHFRRQAELKRRPPLPEINVVTLRRTHREERPTGYRGEPRDYDHSWLRSAHWRKQLCRTRDTNGEKTKDGAWEVRPVYVRACVCGPEDKPLRTPKGTVYSVSR